MWLELAELLRNQVNYLRERALDKGDKSIRKPIFIISLMILSEKLEEGKKERARETQALITRLRGRQVLLCILGGWKFV